MTDLRYESFTVPGEPGTYDAKAGEVVRAIDYGFLERTRDDALIVAQLDRFRAEDALLTVAYDDAQDPRALGANRPVATFGDFTGSLCVREDVIVATRMITEVTVRNTHRRRGILSTMMRSALRRAHADGLALALLTASEGGIYGRFGFGAAAYSVRVETKVHHGLRLRDDVAAAIAASGIRVIIPTWDAFAELYDEVYPRFQAATVGQIGHTHAYRRRAHGDRNAWALPGKDDDLRPLIALDEAGAPVGFALSIASEADRRITVADLGAVSPMAELALWQALGTTDLVDHLVWREAPIDTVLPWALNDPRDAEFSDRRDHLWVRVLDLPTAFVARGLAADGALVFEVTDREGFVAGTWVVRRDAGTTRVERADLAPAGLPVLSLDAEALGSLYLGTVPVTTLVAIGRAAAAPAALSELSRLLQPGPSPRNSYTF